MGYVKSVLVGMVALLLVAVVVLPLWWMLYRWPWTVLFFVIPITVTVCFILGDGIRGERR